MRWTTIVAFIVSLALATLFARLGIWQLHRLAERRAFNAELSSRIFARPVAPSALPADTALANYRRVRVTGTFDYDQQIVITGRSRQGAPGVYLVTPLRPDSGGRAILVNRGWVYSPDASSVNKSLWLEPAHTTVEGYVSPIPPAAANDPEAVNNPRAVRWLDATRIASLLPYPAAPFQLIDLSPGTPDEGAPTRLTVPAMDEGPHRNYAIQWFTFALIALYGSGYLIWLERGKKPGFLVTGNGQAG